MPFSRDSLIAMASLAAWLGLFAIGWPTITGEEASVMGPGKALPGSLGMLPIAVLALLRGLAELMQEGSLRRTVRRSALGLWIAFGVIWAFQVALQHPLYAPSPWAALRLPLFPVLGGAAAVLAWWAADRLDRIALDGAWVLMLPQALILAAVWAVSFVNRVLAGVMTPWHALDSPWLPLLLTTVAVAIRPVGGEDARPIRTALPLVLLPFALDQLTAFLLPDPWSALPRWLGVVAAIAWVVLAPRAPSRSAWPFGLIVLTVPLQVLFVAGSLWGSGLFETRYPGPDDHRWRLTYAEPPSPSDAARLKRRIDLSRLDGDVAVEGSDLVVDLRSVDPSAAEWWLRRVGGQPLLPGVHDAEVGPLADAEIAQATGGSDRPSTWIQPSPPYRLGHLRCPGKHCQISLLHPTRVQPDEILDVNVRFDPLSWQSWLDVELTPEAVSRELARSGPARSTFVLDGRIRGSAKFTARGLEIAVGHPLWARRLAERLKPGPWALPPPTSVTLEPPPAGR